MLGNIVIEDGQVWYDNAGPGLSLPTDEIEIVYTDEENPYEEEDARVRAILHPGREGGYYG